METFYAPPEAINGAECVIAGEEFAHLTHVMRRKEGDAIRIVDGAGTAYDAVIESIAARRAHCRIGDRYPLFHEPRTRMTLAVGLLKNPSRFDFLVEKGTELGVSVFVPLLTERTITRNGRIDRWSAIALSAMKQSGRCVLPRVLPPQPFPAFVAGAPGDSLRLLAHEEGGEQIREVAVAGTRAIVACIGPEGGFSAAEAALAGSAGFRQVTLGSRRLRTETAAMLLAGVLLLEP